MTSSYSTPGVYIQKTDKFPPSVSSVQTAVPAFIGYTEKASDKQEGDLHRIPTKITSILEYEELFGFPSIETTLVATIIDMEEEISQRSVHVSYPSMPSPYRLYYSLQMYFANGGGPCYIVSINKYPSSQFDTPVLYCDLQSGLEAIEKEDEPTLIIFPDATALNKSEFFGLYNNALQQCSRLKNRFTIIDTYSSENCNAASEELRTGITQSLMYGAAYFPYLVTDINYHYEDKSVLIKHVIANQTSGSDLDSVENYEGDLEGKTLDDIHNTDEDLYQRIVSELNRLRVTLPPSSILAGIYSKVDREKGVWKAPANVTIEKVLKPLLNLTRDQMNRLSVDTSSGKSINPLKQFSGKGVLVWGARTLAGNDNEWRYISVRRFYNMVEESVVKATQYAVFEPNDKKTWTIVRSQIENYLTDLWRSGALAGAKPEHAFFAHVGLGETMTNEDILEGRMNIEIGLAQVRPAEFIILKFSHKMLED